MVKEKYSALFSIDMIEAFYRIGNLANPRVARIVAPIQELMERKTLKEGWPTYFLNDDHDEHDEEFKMFPRHAVHGTEETEIIKELRKFSLLPNSMIVQKKRYSAFCMTCLDALLKFNEARMGGRPEKVVVVGVCTDICDLYTVADLRNRDYQVVVPRDCVETFDIPGHNAESENAWALRHMEKILGVKVVDNIDCI